MRFLILWVGYNLLLVFLSHCDKIFLKAPITTSLWFESVYFYEVFFEREHKIIDIFSYKHLEYEISSFFQKNLSNIKYSKIEFYWSILIYSSHTSSGRCNIRSDKVELSDLETIEIGSNFFILKNTLLEEVYIGMTKIRINFLDINSNSFITWFDDFCDYLKKASWSSCNIKNIHFWFYDTIFFLDFNELEGTSCSKTEFFRLLKIGILYNKRFGHNDWQIKKSLYTIVVYFAYILVFLYGKSN